MLKLLPYLFLDDRNPATLQTIMVVSFARTGGLETLFVWLDELWNLAGATLASAENLEQEKKDMLVDVHDAIETILSVLQMFSSSKLLTESSHTGPLTSRDDKNRKVDFFEPHEFLVDVRRLMLPRIKNLWMDKKMDRAPATTMRFVTQIIINILRASGEQKPAVTAPPAPVGTAAPNIFNARPFVPDPASVTTLLDMGFPRSAAELALTRCSNQLERATEYLLTHSEVVAAAMYEQEREEAEARAAALAAVSTPSTSDAPAGSTAESSAENTAENATEANNPESSGSQQRAEGSQGPMDTGNGGTNVDNDFGDEEDEDEAEMLRQALALSQALDASLSAETPSDAPHTQESTTGEASSSSEAPVPAQAAPTESVEPTEPAEPATHTETATTTTAATSTSVDPSQDEEDDEDDDDDDEESIDIEDEEPEEDAELKAAEAAKREEEYKAALEIYEAHKEELSKGRDELRPLLVPRCLELIESIDEAVFYIRDLLMLLCKEKDSTVMDELIKDLEKAGNFNSIQDDKAGAAGKAFGTRLRLLALLFGDATIQTKMSDYGSTISPLLNSILAQHMESQGTQAGNTWLSPMLLMVESFLSLTNEPKVVPDETTAEGKAKAQEDKEMKEDIISPAEKEKLLHFSIALLKQQDLVKDIALSVFRILVRLTRQHSLAMEFLNASGLDLIFSTLKSESLGVQGQQSFIIMIVRHIIEDAIVLQATIEREIVRWLAQPSRGRTSDLINYLRHNNFLGLRDLDAFIAGTMNVCKVTKYDSAFKAQQLTLSKPANPSKPDEDKASGVASQETDTKGKGKAVDQETEMEAAESSETAAEQPQPSIVVANEITEASRKLSSEISETVVHFLVSELLNVRVASTGTDSSPSGASNASGSSPKNAPTQPVPPVSAQASSSDKDTKQTEDEPHDTNFVYRCFLLQCLNELLISYPSCKVDMMNFSRRRAGKEPSTVATKPRGNWLSYLLNDLIPCKDAKDTESQLTEPEFQISLESNFASAVLVAMCSSMDEEEEKKPVSGLVLVRRFIVDGIIRSFKDAVASSDPVEIKYRKLRSLSDLSYKILGASSSSSAVGVKANEDMSVNIAKVMLEKYFIATLTNVLADIDLNYPDAKGLVNAVLKPLEHLTKLSLKMSRAADPGAPKVRRQGTPLSAAGSGTGSGDGTDTPDLYRNSSLGMFDGANMESEEVDEEDEYGEDDDIFEGDEYEEETASDASDVSDDDYSDEDVDEALDEVVDRNPFHRHSHELSDDDEDQDDEDMGGDHHDDLDEDMEAELQEVLDQDDDEEMMEWNADSRPIVLHGDEIGEVLHDAENGPPMGEPEFFEAGDHGHHHHHAHAGDDGMDDEDEDGEDDEDADEDEEVDDDDLDEEGDDIVLLDDAEGFDPVRTTARGGPWDMRGTFIINDQDGLLNGAQIIDLRGRRPRPAGRRLDDRDHGFFWETIADRGRFSYVDEEEFPFLGASARNPFMPVSDDAITHPLLTQPRPAPATVVADSHRRAGSRSATLTDWQAFGEFLSSNPSQILGTLMNGSAIRAGHGAIRVEVNPFNTAALAPVDRIFPGGIPGSGITATISAGPTTETLGSRKATMFSIVREFVPFSTSQRWSQECRMMYGATVQEKASRLGNHVVNALIPAAKEEHRLKLERDAKDQEQRRLAEVEKKRVAEEKRQAEEKARLEMEAAEAAAAELEAARRAEEAAARAARGEAEEPSAEELAMEVEGTSSSAPAEPEAEAEPAAPARRTVMIGGELVDITDSDIDIEFMEALPDDMRREVYNDYLQSRRPAPPAQQPPTTTTTGAQADVNQEFMEALPGNMRAELEEILRGHDAGAGANIADPFLTAFNEYTISRLMPQLRQLYQDGSNRSLMTPALLAETNAVLDQIPGHYRGIREARDILAGTAPGSSSAALKKSLVPRDAIQLVDKSSLATLVRLMFLPQPPSKNILNKLLVNLCENSKTRSELISLLLSILQDGGADLAAVDKSFAQMSLRGKVVVKAHHHHKGKGSSSLSTPASIGVDNVPNLVARRCFETLYYIVSYNPQAVTFFLTEHDNVTLKRSPSKKNKGKEKAVSSKYPVVLLLDLLERPIIVENSALMEQLMTLLSVICRPLATLVKDEEDKKKAEEQEEKKEEEKKEEEVGGETLATGSGSNALPAEQSTAATTTAATSTTATTSAAADTTASTTASTSASATTSTEESAGSTSTTTAAATSTEASSSSSSSESKPEAKVTEPEVPPFKPPVIPEHCLQLIVRVLTAGECSSRTFQYTLSVIQNLSALEGAREVVTTELVCVARDLGAGILENLDSLSQTLANAMSGVDVQGVALEQFSPASSKQAKLLRVLKTVDYMYSRKQSTTQTPATPQVNIELAPTVDPEEADAVMPRSMREGGQAPTKLTKDEEQATAIYNSLTFDSLWTKVGDSLELIRERNDMIHVATVLLPLIESFMVVCKYVGLRPSTLEMGEAESKTVGNNSTEELFLQFTEKHSKILNIMVRNTPALMSGSFSLLVHNPKMLEFDNKRNYFTQQLHKRNPARERYGTLQMNVRREMVFVDSFSQWQSKSGEEIKYSKLNVHFHGEEGVDAGGVTREWFQVLARQMFNPDYALFITSAADKLTYQPNRASEVNSDHLLFFKFIGRVIGKAIYDARLLDAYFTRSFYKHILGRPVDYRDVEAVDPEYYKSLVWMLENDITDIVDETFSMEADYFGANNIVDLKPNGRNIPVTEQNKQEYVKYITEHKLTLAIKDQIQAFLQGFHEIIPAHLISIFNEQELELLISGLPDIDVDEWKNNTEYQNYSQASPQIQNFWRAVRSFDQTERAKLLQFVTGTSKVPLGGFSQLQGISGVQKFQIHKDFSSVKRLPSAHTW